MINKILDDLIQEAREYPDWKAVNALRCAKKELLKEIDFCGKWISVKDRLPNDNQPVIVSDGGEPEFAIFYDYYNGYGPTFVTPDCYEEERIEGITHWMPLPEPPKEET